MICMLVYMYYELVKKVILVGKLVIVEKLFCDIVEYVKELLVLGWEKGVVVMFY